LIEVLLFAVGKFDFWIYRVFDRIYFGILILCYFAVDFDVDVLWFQYVVIKCQLDAKDEIYCRSYCLLNMFQAPLCPSSGARECYTDGCCLWCLVFWFSSCRYGVELGVVCLVYGLLQLHTILTT
jgi:hypothetical protein